jgi:hypothetical protein
MTHRCPGCDERRGPARDILLDQLGGIWEIIFWITLPEPLPTEVKRSL